MLCNEQLLSGISALLGHFGSAKGPQKSTLYESEDEVVDVVGDLGGR